MKVLILGSGGREHALSHVFCKQGHQVYCLPGNPGTEEICCQISMQNAAPLEVAKALGIDLTVVGPETLLEQGIKDLFASQNKLLFGPTKRAAQLESSKAWAKELMAKYAIPTARFKICHNSKQAYDTAKVYFKEWNGLVIKPSGLTAGKGVAVCTSIEEAMGAIHEIMDRSSYGHAGNEVVIEERLCGKEVSLLAFCDGNRMFPMIPSQDHKRLYNGDCGPNTGGVGAYAPVPFVNQTVKHVINSEIVERTNLALQKENILYQGILYFGIMLTDTGPKVLEYNCRFGDPETQAILPLLSSDLGDIMLACLKGNLKENELHWSNQAACCVVMTSSSYPQKSAASGEILGLNNAKESANCLVFHASTTRSPEGNIHAAGGRVLGITGLGNTLKEAITEAYKAVNKIKFKGAHYRTDIAQQAF